MYYIQLFQLQDTKKKTNSNYHKESGLLNKFTKLNYPLATWCEELTHWKRPWCWERLRAGGEGTTEDEMVGWHHRLNRHEFEHALGAGGQGGLACCSPWGCRVRHDWSTELTRQSWVSPQGWFNVVACQGHSCSFSSMVILKLANFWPQDAPSRSRDYTLSYLYQWERTSVTVP